MKLTSLGALPAAGLISGLVPVQYSGAIYKVALSDISGGLTASVSPQQYGGDPTGVAAADAAVAAAFATGRPVLLDGWYRLTTTLITPAYSASYLKNYNCGFIADMAAGDAIQWGAGSIVPSQRVKSVAYPYTALANTSPWALGIRKITPGSGCRFGNVWVEDVTTGVDCWGVTDVQIGNIYARNIRNKEGFGAAFHTHDSTDCYLGRLDAKNCDRASEIEYNSKRCGVLSMRAESVYPVPYSGQPANFATYSFIMSVHSHAGEGGCRDITYGDAWISDCLGAVHIQRSTATAETDYPQGIRVGDVVINNPRARVPIEDMCGLDVKIKSIRFTGTPNASVSQLIQIGESGASTLARDIEIDQVTVDDGAFIGRILAINAPDCGVNKLAAGPQGGTSTLAPVIVQAYGDRAMLKQARFRGAKYHSSLYDVAGTPAAIKRKHTSYTLDATNPATASRSAGWTALAGKYEVDNADF